VTPAHRHRSFRRLETDVEFRARLATLKRVVWTVLTAGMCHGEALDLFAEEMYRVQRRIVEVEG